MHELKKDSVERTLCIPLWSRAIAVKKLPQILPDYDAVRILREIVLIWKGIFALKKTWILAPPLIVAGIGYLLELLIPWPFNGFVSGFESFGWIVMFLGGRKLVMQAIQEQSTMEEKS